MEQPTRNDRSATMLLRMSGVAFILLGAFVLVVVYLAVTQHPTQAVHTTGGVVVGISISVLGVAATLLRRWAVVVLSFLALSYSFFVTWGAFKGLPLPWSLLLSAVCISIASIPAISAYFAWRELR